MLKPEGRFIFSVMHPSFNSIKGLVWAAERIETEDGEVVDTYFVKISDYIEPVAYKGVAMLGQPELQHYFHRPISVLLNVFFQNGFVLDGLEEPVFTANSAGDDPLGWNNFTRIPLALVVRLRPKQGEA